MRRNLIKTMFVVMLLTAALMPVAQLGSDKQNEINANDAEHVIRPMIELLRENPIYGANAAVEPMIDIEDAWAIEDEREEAQEPLIVGMRNGNRVLGYDEGNRTFYCTLGNDWQEGDPWPELDLYVQQRTADEKAVRVNWIDDYTYDDCAEAIADGYSYELLAYTDKEYEYFSVVFTGLPIVSIRVQEDMEIGDEYIPSCVSIADADQERSTVEMAKVHIRGNHRSHPKIGYRIECYEISDTGRSKRKQVSALGMEADSDWLLISNAQDISAVRNYLSFDMWKRWNGQQKALNILENELVEVFVQNRYMGLYQLMQRVDGEKQIEKAGGNPQTDCLVRTGSNRDDRQQRDYNSTNGFPLEYQYEANGNAERAFDLIENYIRLSSLTDPLNDAEFAALAEQCIDLDALLSYYLFVQASGLTEDNTNNNLYIWIAKEKDRYVYRYGPWDMDNAISKIDYNPDGSVYLYFDLNMEVARRILDLDVMNSRERLWEMWRKKRETVFADEQIEQWIRSVEDEVYRSGAYRRESKTWLYNEQNLYLDELLEFEYEQMNTIEKVLSQRWPLKDDQAAKK